MTELFNLRAHLDEISRTVYHEPDLEYHRQMTDLAIQTFVAGNGFSRVLDVGIGNGYALPRLKAAAREVVGITTNDDECRNARAAGFDVRLMDMNFLDLPDASFDLVWCRHALEHSIMPMVALMEFKRVLSPGGALYVEVPSDNILHIENCNHYSLFSDPAWMSLFRKAGFDLHARQQMQVRLATAEGPRAITAMDIYWQYFLRKPAEVVHE